MAELLNPSIDFSTLGNLGTLYKQGQADQLRQQTLANLGNGAATPQDLLQAGIKIGDLNLASLGQRASDHADTLAQQDREFGRASSNDARSASQFQQTYALQKRAADRADDPTPDNFVADPNAPGGYRPIGPADPAYLERVASSKARAAASVPPEGFTQGPDGVLAPRTGGPTDPTYLGRVDAEKARAKGDVPTVIGAGSSIIVPNKAAEGPVFTNRFTGDGLTEDARDIKARQIINGDYSGLQNIGRGAQAGRTLESISNRAAEILTNERGMSPDDAAAHLGKKVQEFKASSMGQGAEARTAGVREANLNLILRAADAAIPAALEASEKVARTGWVPVNQVIQKGEVVSSNPDLKRFGMANLQLAEHWARAMNPTGVMRESDRDKALSFLSTADSKDTYRQAVDQLRTQITRERDAVRGAPVTPSAPSFRADTQPAPPKVGELRDGYRYKSGDPSDSASWVKQQ